MKGLLIQVPIMAVTLFALKIIASNKAPIICKPKKGKLPVKTPMAKPRAIASGLSFKLRIRQIKYL